jgi:hypothetical protein
MKRYILIIVAILLGYSLHAQSASYNCRYWFDQNHAQAATVAFSENNWQAELDVGSLSEGLHTMLLQICDTSSVWSIPKTYMFYKIENQQDISNMVYRCWFDNDIVHRQTDYLGDGHLLLDVDALSEGIHTLNVMLGDNAPRSYMFMKVAVQDPMTEMQYRCWFDDDSSNIQTGSVGMGIFELEVGDLSNGVHTVHIQLDNGKSSVPQSYVFYKRQVGGSIVKWEYWLNGDQSNKHTTNLSPFVDTLDIVTLLPVETWPIRSSCFHFHPNDDEPYLNAKNEIAFRFWDVDNHYIDISKFYVDYNVSEPIVADILERNTTVSMEAPRDNQIRWYKLDINRGDYLSFRADKACSMQLFAPSGEEVYNASGPESLQETGFNVWEDGAYYLAVHDVMGSGETVSVTYNWFYRYTIASYDVHLVGNGGRSTITFQGNGFNSLLDVYLVNVQNDTINWFDIGHESNTTTTVTFDFNGAEIGYYTAVFHFEDEDLTIENCITVEEATPFEFDVSVSFATQFLVNTSNKYVYKVHNKSNMTAYNVPLGIHVFNPNAESLTRVDIDGFDFKSYIIDIFSYYTSCDIDSLENVIEQKKLVSGDMYGFVNYYNTDFIPDAPYVYYTFLCPDLRPNTTEAFTIEVKPTDMVYVYMWYPEEWENEDPEGNLSKGTPHYGFGPQWCHSMELIGRDCDGNPLPPGPPGGGGGGSGPVWSLDPNDIFGYISESGSHYMRQEIQNIHYEIEFENDTTLATAAAHTIMVRDTLDATKFDLNSLAAHSVTIGDKQLELNGEKNFARTLDMRPEMYVIAQIEQDYDPATGIIAWTIKSLDPMTMEPTDNPFQGVLPVNYNGNGIGFIDYSVNLKQAFADGTEVSNRAGIVFDQNDVIMTPTWTNIVDAVKPTSQINEVSFEADTLNFNFVSSDNRSGVWYHTLYYRNDSTEMEWKVKKAKILGNSFILKFDDYQTTEYLVMAVDSAGNHEDKDMVAEYIFVYDGPVPVTQTMSLKSGWNWVSFNVEITLADIQEALVEAMPDRSITIKSQTGKTSYNFNTHRWHGNIASLDVTRMYKIKAASECELILKGKPVNPADHPIIINRGVNWIAFPLNVDMNTVDAFDGFVVNGDKIKSQIGKSQFNNGRWQGQMNKLEPGKGYIYTSSATEDRTFVFPTGAK